MPQTEDYEEDILNLPNTVGVEYDEETGTVVALVKKKVPETELRSQDVVDNAVSEDTDVIEVGEIESLSQHKDRYRPIKGGVSEGPVAKRMAGTGGPLGRVTDSDSLHWSPSTQDGELVRVSNAHVYAESRSSTGMFGDVIGQPGRLDTSRNSEEIKVGKLIGYVPTVDGVEVDCAARSATEHDTPRVQGLKEEFPTKVRRDYSGLKGETLAKSGRTTGVSGADVVATSASVNVNMGDKTVLFRNQILTNYMSDPGDSGSPVFDADGALAGLLFAGSDTITVLNKIAVVEETLGVEFLTADALDEPEPAPEPEDPSPQLLSIGPSSLFSSTEYSFSVEGDVSFSGKSTSQVGNTVNGWLLRWSNTYRIDGYITDQAIPDDVPVYLNSIRVEPDDLVELSKDAAGIRE